MKELEIYFEKNEKNQKIYFNTDGDIINKKTNSKKDGFIFRIYPEEVESKSKKAKFYLINVYQYKNQRLCEMSPKRFTRNRFNVEELPNSLKGSLKYILDNYNNKEINDYSSFLDKLMRNGQLYIFDNKFIVDYKGVKKFEKECEFNLISLKFEDFINLRKDIFNTNSNNIKDIIDSNYQNLRIIISLVKSVNGEIIFLPEKFEPIDISVSDWYKLIGTNLKSEEDFHVFGRDYMDVFIENTFS